MDERLRRLTYCSKSLLTPKFAFEQLFQILEWARRVNSHNSVTGALILVKGCFAQVLEGPSPEVDNIMQSIARDTRHTDVTTILVEENIKRFFPEWSMAYPSRILRSSSEVYEVLHKGFEGDRTIGPYIHQLLRESPSEQPLSQAALS